MPPPRLAKRRLRRLQDLATAAAAVSGPSADAFSGLLQALRGVVGKYARLNTSDFAPFMQLLRRLESVAGDDEIVDALELLGGWAGDEVLDVLPEGVLLHGGHHLLAAERWVRGGRFKHLRPTRAIVDHIYAAATCATEDDATTSGSGSAAWHQAVASVHAGARVAVADDFVPEALASQLSVGFKRNAFFLQEFHRQHLTTFAYRLADLPRNAIEQLIQHYAAHLPPSERAGGAAPVLGAEWWVHRRRSNLWYPGHNFHFDHDEGLRFAKGVWQFPRYSTVFYVDAAPRSGPTVVLNSSVAPRHRRVGESLATCHLTNGSAAWAVWPRARRVIWFDGRLLHGVFGMAAPRARELPTGLFPEPRTTLMVQFQTYTCHEGAANQHAGQHACQRGAAEMLLEDDFPLVSEMEPGSGVDIRTYEPATGIGTLRESSLHKIGSARWPAPIDGAFELLEGACV